MARTLTHNHMMETSDLKRYIDSNWQSMRRVLQIGYKRVSSEAKRFVTLCLFPFKPVFVAEGEMIPWYVGMSDWIPQDFRNPPMDPITFKWQKRGFVIPVNLVVIAYNYTRFKLKRGFMLPPEMYRNQIVQIKEICPHCDKNVYDFPIPRNRW